MLCLRVALRTYSFVQTQFIRESTNLLTLLSFLLSLSLHIYCMSRIRMRNNV
jgi:hypothetical protein